MNNTDLQTVYRAVVVSKLLYASSAWIGFTTAADRLRVEAFLRRSKRNGFCDADLQSFEELNKSADQKLFEKLLRNNNNVLSNCFSRGRLHLRTIAYGLGFITGNYQFTSLDLLIVTL